MGNATARYCAALLALFIVLLPCALCNIEDEMNSVMKPSKEMGKDPMYEALADLKSGVPQVPLERLRHAGEEMISRAEALQQAKDIEAGHCRINYNSPCPELWTMEGDPSHANTNCIAPSSYKGICMKRGSFDTKTREQKANLAAVCNFKWPCLGISQRCTRDYSHPCPIGFLLKDDNFTCIPNLVTYTGGCAMPISFEHYTESSKRRWAAMCGADWPCITPRACEELFQSRCPLHWTYDDVAMTCTAPQHYQQSNHCSSPHSFTYYTPAMKTTYAAKCKVEWPCQDDCEIDYNSKCPKEWKLGANGTNCVLGSAVMSNRCAITELSFDAFTLSDKKHFAERCDVQWPCKASDVCKRDWLAQCPLGWFQQKIGEGMKCLKKGGTRPESFSVYSEEERRKWASLHQSPWPCGEEEASSRRKENAVKMRVATRGGGEEATPVERGAVPHGIGPKHWWAVSGINLLRGPVEPFTGKVLWLGKGHSRLDSYINDIQSEGRQSRHSPIPARVLAERYKRKRKPHSNVSIARDIQGHLQQTNGPYNEEGGSIATVGDDAPVYDTYKAGPKGYSGFTHYLLGSSINQ